MCPLDSAFWVWNLVGNMAYGERAAETYPIILDKINLFQNQLLKQTTTLDAALLHQYASDPAAAVALATKQTVDMGDKMTKDWLQVRVYAPYTPIQCTSGDSGDSGVKCRLQCGLLGEEERVLVFGPHSSP